jgi:magnesium-transporting ATPase (P-type)
MSKESPQAQGSKSSSDVSTQYLSKPAHSLTYEEVIQELGTNSDDGLTTSDVKQRLEKYGGNVLEGDEGVSFAKIVIRQIANAMMLVSSNFNGRRRNMKTQCTNNPKRFSSSLWPLVSVSNHGLKVVLSPQ